MISGCLRPKFMVKPLDCHHNPVVLDESPNSAAPSLVVCSICGETLEAECHTAREREFDLADWAVSGCVQ